MIPLTKKEYKSYQLNKLSHFQIKFEIKYPNDKKYHRVNDHCHYTGK